MEKDGSSLSYRVRERKTSSPNRGAHGRIFSFPLWPSGLGEIEFFEVFEILGFFVVIWCIMKENQTCGVGYVVGFSFAGVEWIVYGQ